MIKTKIIGQLKVVEFSNNPSLTLVMPVSHTVCYCLMTAYACLMVLAFKAVQWVPEIHDNIMISVVLLHVWFAIYYFLYLTDPGIAPNILDSQDQDTMQYPKRIFSLPTELPNDANSENHSDVQSFALTDPEGGLTNVQIFQSRISEDKTGLHDMIDMQPESLYNSGLTVSQPSFSASTFRYCEICNVNQNKFIHHCFSCDVCMENLDHHCVFIGKCVARKNMIAFNALLIVSICLFMSQFRISMLLH